jgi:hypothetical protein
MNGGQGRSYPLSSFAILILNQLVEGVCVLILPLLAREG